MINKVILIGNVGSDPEIRSMQSGDKVANLSLATSERWTDKQTGDKREKTEWHRVVVFGPLVNVVENYVKKGSKLWIEGKLQTRKWTDQSGQDKWTTEVVLQGYNANLTMLDSKGSPSAERGAPVQTQPPLTEHNEAKSNGYMPQQEPPTESAF